MSSSFVEGNLHFEFGARWTRLLKWDREAAHAQGMKHVNLGKDVDFVGLLDGKVLFFIEVKDHRGHPRSAARCDLGQEFELKVRSTVAALVGAHRRQMPGCSDLFEVLAMPSRARQVRLVMWVEEDPITALSTLAVHDKRRRSFDGTEIRQRKREVGWLDADTTVVGSFHDFAEDLPDLRVTRLSTARQHVVEAIIQTLHAKKDPLPDAVRWEIEGTLDEERLKRWWKLAPTIPSARHLLRQP